MKKPISGPEETSTQTPFHLPIPDIPSYTPPMKHILAPILLLVLLFPSLALGEEVTMDDLVVREGLHYKKYTDVPFTGKTTGKIQGTFKDGVRDGPWVSYHDNGQLFLKGTHKDGEMDGPWVSYNENGTVDEIFTGTYENGVKVD